MILHKGTIGRLNEPRLSVQCWIDTRRGRRHRRREPMRGTGAPRKDHEQHTRNPSRNLRPTMNGKKHSRSRPTSPVCLVHLVDLVCFGYLVDLVHLVMFAQSKTRQTRRTKHRSSYAGGVFQHPAMRKRLYTTRSISAKKYPTSNLAVSGESDPCTALNSMFVPWVLRIVPATALAGSVAPINSRFFLIALSPCRTSTTTGPDTINEQRLSKNGRALCTA